MTGRRSLSRHAGRVPKDRLKKHTSWTTDLDMRNRRPDRLDDARYCDSWRRIVGLEGATACNPGKATRAQVRPGDYVVVPGARRVRGFEPRCRRREDGWQGSRDAAGRPLRLGMAVL
jgi:hypothetical protein